MKFLILFFIAFNGYGLVANENEPLENTQAQKTIKNEKFAPVKKYYYEPKNIIDLPTAGVTDKSHLGVRILILDSATLGTEIIYSPINDFSFGLSYYASKFIGNNSISGPKYPSIQLKYRLFDESLSFPALAIGINTQGNGYYFQQKDRFRTLSQGIYLVASKNFIWQLGDIALHLGTNYSFDQSSNKSPNIFLGFEQTFLSKFSINLEYNANLDDNDKEIIKAKGLLNSSLKYYPYSNFAFEIQIKDLLQNSKYNSGINRNLVLEYVF